MNPRTSATTLRLSKHHGAGNDFLVLVDREGTSPIDAVLARALCDRRYGIGADGVIRVIAGRNGTDLAMELRNADGGEAEMSGNGVRCLAQAAVGAGLVDGPTFTLETRSGVREVEYHDGTEADGIGGDGDGRCSALRRRAVRSRAVPSKSTWAIPIWCSASTTPQASTSRERAAGSRIAIRTASTSSSSTAGPGTRRDHPCGCGSVAPGRPSPAGPGASPPPRRCGTGARSGTGSRSRSPGGRLDGRPRGRPRPAERTGAQGGRPGRRAPVRCWRRRERDPARVGVHRHAHLAGCPRADRAGRRGPTTGDPRRDRGEPRRARAPRRDRRRRGGRPGPPTPGRARPGDLPRPGQDRRRSARSASRWTRTPWSSTTSSRRRSSATSSRSSGGPRSTGPR